MTQISFHQIPAVCEQLLGERRHDDALKVLNVFIEHDAPHFPALEYCLPAVERIGKSGAVENTLDALRQRFPDNVRTWWLDARLQQTRNAWRNLQAALDQIEACGDRSGKVALWRGRAHVRLSQPKDALDALEFAGPDAGKPGEYAHVRAGALLLLKRHDDAIALLRDYLEQAHHNELTAGCWKLLGKALDREGAYDEAFEAFTRGNQLSDKLYGMAFEHNPLGQRVGAFRKLMERSWCERWSADYGAPSTADSPVFLIGFPRSGTTLMEQVLDAHPGIVGLEERPLVESVWDYVPSLLKGPDPGLSDPVERQASELSALADLSPSGLAGLREVYSKTREDYLNWPEGTVLVDKLPLNLSSLPLILRLFPHARFIVALRHPCDCILSNYMQDFAMNPGMHFMVDLERAAWLYREMFELLEQSREALDIENQLHFIRYEDLVTEFEPAVQRLLGFLGVDWDPSVSRYHEHAQQRGTLGTPSYEGVTRELYSGSIGRWCHYACHLSPIVPMLSDTAKQFGYSLEISGSGKADSAV